MGIRSFASKPLSETGEPRRVLQAPMRHGSAGHSHHRSRELSRRLFLRGAALAAGAVVSADLLFPSTLRPLSQSGAGPNPIPGGIQPFGPGTEVFHVFPPAFGVEPSSIFDFNGFVGLAQIQGPWSGGGIVPPPGTPLVYEADMRFMTGEYIATDGSRQNGAFGFV